MKTYKNFREYHIEELRKPEEAKAYIEVSMEEYERDKDIEAFLTALRDVAEAQGGISKLAKRVNLNRQNLYKALSVKGNPKLDTINTILHGLGFRLSVESIGNI